MKKISLLLMIAGMVMSCNLYTATDDVQSDVPDFGEVLISEVTANGATLSCTLKRYGSYSIQERGFSYGTKPKPYETGKAVEADYVYSSEFSATLKGLEPNTKYYVTPYVKVGEKEYFVGSDQEVIFSTRIQGDYSSARVESDNRDVELNLRGCYRNGKRVKIEATILNKGIYNYTNYYLYQNNYGYKVGNYPYNSHVEDDLYTDYNNYAVTVDLNSKSGSSGVYTQLPLGATKILTVLVDGVPSNAKTINVYIATEFRDMNPREYAYLTFENVPIY